MMMVRYYIDYYSCVIVVLSVIVYVCSVDMLSFTDYVIVIGQ